MSFLEWVDNIIHHATHAEVTVKQGDTLSEIAEGMTGDANRYHEVEALNPGLDPDVIHPGDVIKVPLDWVKPKHE